MDDQSCPICYEDLQDKVVLSCRHEYCRPCLTEYFQHQVTTRNVPIRCPMCQGDACLDTVKQVLSEADFARLQSLLRAQEEKSTATTECPRCSHPNPSSLELCQACNCRLPEDCPLSMALIHQTTLPCSHCGIRIEKASGCDHIVCSWCKKDMCWSCGSHAHLQGDGPHRYCQNCKKGYIHHDREQAQIRRRRRELQITAIETAMADLELMVDPEARKAAEEEIRRDRIRRERRRNRALQSNKRAIMDSAFCDLEALVDPQAMEERRRQELRRYRRLRRCVRLDCLSAAADLEALVNPAVMEERRREQDWVRRDLRLRLRALRRPEPEPIRVISVDVGDAEEPFRDGL